MLPCPIDRRSVRRAGTDSRRTRLRLRELCDEVLASYRVARGDDPVTSEDRALAESLLADVAPRRASRPVARRG